jgi:hypothetical protein
MPDTHIVISVIELPGLTFIGHMAFPPEYLVTRSGVDIATRSRSTITLPPITWNLCTIHLYKANCRQGHPQWKIIILTCDGRRLTALASEC